jgi:hypothetical protein
MDNMRREIAQYERLLETEPDHDQADLIDYPTKSSNGLAMSADGSVPRAR